jgi:hypothetical protein
MRTRTNLAIDALLVTSYLIAANPSVTGIGAHEWVSLGFALIAGVHLIRHREWVARTLRRFFSRIPSLSRANLIADGMTAVSATGVMVSGLAISRAIASTVGLTSVGGSAWRIVHVASAGALLLSVALHACLHWRWIARAAKLHIIDPIRLALRGAEAPEIGVRVVAWGVPVLVLAGVLGLAMLGTAGTSSPTVAALTTASTTSGTLTCPATGCTATTCHNGR